MNALKALVQSWVEKLKRTDGNDPDSVKYKTLPSPVFRGKNKHTGEWISGSLWVTTILSDDYYSIYHKVKETNQKQWIEVLPETVGQYIGIDDPDGTPIFSGDLIGVYYSDEDGSQPVLHEVRYQAKDGYPAYDLTPRLSDNIDCNSLSWLTHASDSSIVCWRVVGNVHDEACKEEESV